MSHASPSARLVRLRAREVFDSRARPTVEVEAHTDTGHVGRTIVPSGASTGQFEAHELRDGDPLRLSGLGVRQAVRNVNEVLSRVLAGSDVFDQVAFDRRLLDIDGTPNKGRLGANALLGASLALAHAAAAVRGVPLFQSLYITWEAVRSAADAAATPVTCRAPLAVARAPAFLGSAIGLPVPMVNMISGGLHAGRNLDLQDFLIMPLRGSTYAEALEAIVATYHSLGRCLKRHGFEGTLVGDEGGYGPRLERHEQALELIVEAIEQIGLSPGRDMAIALDVAATHFVEPLAPGAMHATASPHEGPSAAEGPPRTYRLQSEKITLTAAQLVDRLESWVRNFPIISIEDGVADDDWLGWRMLTERLGSRVQLIGDDLFVTNAERLRAGIERGVGNSVLIKVNQIGTLTETLETLALALRHGYWPVISARSGETEDTTIAHLAVGTGAGQLKVGSVARSERLAKYNELLRIEEQLPHGAYPAANVFGPLHAAGS